MKQHTNQAKIANNKPKIWLTTLIASAVIPIALGVFFHAIFASQQWVNQPLHSLLESIGAFSAIILALFILTTQRNQKVSSSYIWVATTLIGMGLLDGFHAGIAPGNNFIWLHSLATFVGGVTFALVALPDKITNQPIVKFAPAFMAFFALSAGILSVVFPSLVPEMLSDKEFSVSAQLLNLIGGAGFIIAWLYFSMKNDNSNTLERKLLANHTLLFGAAAVLFQFSILWDATWWLWHFLRLIAYLVILSFFVRIYLKSANQIKKNEQRLKENSVKLKQERALINGIIENSSSLICLKDINGKYLLCNTNFANFFSRAAEDIIGKEATHLLSQPVAEYDQKQDLKVIDNKRRFEEEINFWMDQEEYSFIASRFPLINHLGEVYAVGLVLTDISIRKQVEKNLRLAKRIIDHTSEGIIVTDKHHRIEEVNFAFSEISGYSYQEVTHSQPVYCDAENNKGHDFTEIKRCLETEGYWSGEVWATKKNGQNYTIWISVTAIYDESKQISHYVSIFHDISKSKAIEAQLEELAYYDSLTQLPNRTLFKERLQHDIATSHRSNEKLALLLFDLDEFKLINDSMGHDIGDEVLQQAATRIQSCIRDSDTSARLGGDEFTVILLNLHDSQSPNKIANKILEVLKEPFYIKEFTISVGASIGISIYPDDGKNVSELVKSADLALYKAKASGGNSYHYFSKELQDIANESMLLKNEIREAIKSSEFVNFYQAKVDARSNKIIGMEALVRWNHPKKGLISPFTFIPHAEQSGSIIEIGEIVLIQACLDAKQWQEKFHSNLTLSVNLSTKQFQDKQLLEKIEFALKLSGLPPSTLELEITESSVMEDIEEALVTMKSIHNLGINIAIDDFGTGYSSLAYLKRFPIKTIKIDKSFVQDIETDVDDRSIIETIILLSEKMNVSVIAEGVETKTQLGFLQTNHCHLIQGYLFHKPENKSQFEYHLQKHFNNKDTQ